MKTVFAILVLGVAGCALKIPCPGGNQSCPSSMTCCLMLDNTSYGCCPYRNAVCCSDKIHCCPQDQKCDVKRSKCLSKFSPYEGIIPFPPAGSGYRGGDAAAESIPESPPESGGGCDGGGSSPCDKDQTCCRGTSGRRGCCPFKDGVCCHGADLCCPAQFECDIERKVCLKVPKEQEQNVDRRSPPTPCHHSAKICPGHETCCPYIDGAIGCCPESKATCCSDKLHCCPHGYACKDGGCTPQFKRLLQDLLENLISYPLKQSGLKKPKVMEPVKLLTAEDRERNSVSLDRPSASVVCPGGRSQCPSDETCCLLKNGRYGCCPYAMATCCPDRETCCPHGFDCDVNRCIRKSGPLSTTQEEFPATEIRESEIVPMEATLNSRGREEGSLGVTDVCPDRKSQCPVHQNCCLVADGVYGCCPFPQGTCCRDHKHCCPQGYDCDYNRCIRKPGYSSTLQEEISATEIRESEVMEPVKLLTAEDRERNSVSLDRPSASVVCPGGRSQCPSDETCCLLKNGRYGCCPYAMATCCPDRETCCPHGFDCDFNRCIRKSGPFSTTQEEFPATEIRESEAAPWMTAVPAPVFEVGSRNGTITCPDKKSSCPHKDTCCLMKDGTYGCCPFKLATCCRDGIHCCPHGFACAGSSCVASER